MSRATTARWAALALASTTLALAARVGAQPEQEHDPSTAESVTAPAPDSVTAPAADSVTAPAADSVAQPAAESPPEPGSAPPVAEPATPAVTPHPSGGPFASGVTWDFQLELGVGVALQGELERRFLGKARAGLLLVQEPYFIGVGPTFSLGGLAGTWGVGCEADLVHLWSGMTAQAGLSYGSDEALVSHLSVGYAIFVAEWQHDFAAATPSSDALYFKIRIPVGILAFML